MGTFERTGRGVRSSSTWMAANESGGAAEENFAAFGGRSDTGCFVGARKPRKGKHRYRQSYREAWESVIDFKGWLCSVPGNTSKAYCKLCQKELHSHRLSLLKHKVTFKHQRKEEEFNFSEFLEFSKLESQGENNLFCKNYEKNKEVAIVTSNETKEGSSNLRDNTMLDPAITSEALNEEEVSEEIGALSTHVLDTSKGIPASFIHVVLYKLIKGRWTLIHEGLTNSNGRYTYEPLTQEEFSDGRYKLHYDVNEYFEKQNQETIFPFVEVVFDIKKSFSKYHIPLLLSPYGYSTYKGS